MGIRLNDIKKWAQEYFKKPLSVNVIHHAICRCQLKLYHAKRKPYLNMVQHRLVLWAKTNFQVESGKVFNDPNLTFLLVLQAKEEGDRLACYQSSVQILASLMVW